jgi:hypothetical protein
MKQISFMILDALNTFLKGLLALLVNALGGI